MLLYKLPYIPHINKHTLVP